MYGILISLRIFHSEIGLGNNLVKPTRSLAAHDYLVLTREYWGKTIETPRTISLDVLPFKVVSRNTSPLQKGTPTKLVCPIKKKPKMRGKCSRGAHQSDLPSKIESIGS